MLKLILTIQNYRQSFTNKIPAMDKNPETIRKAVQALVKRVQPMVNRFDRGKENL